MANVNCYGSVVSSRQSIVPLHNAATTEASQDQIDTDGDFTGASQVFGTFANQQYPGFVASRAGLQCENDFIWAYVQSAGKIKLALPTGGGAGTSGGNCDLPAPLPYPKAIASGDSIQVLVNAAATRTAAVSVACSSGEYHVFQVTVSGAGEQEFLSVLDNQSLGLTLQGRTITHIMANPGANDAELQSPVYVLDGSGIPIGSIGFTASAGDCAQTFSPVRIPVALNSRMVFRTDA